MRSIVVLSVVVLTGCASPNLFFTHPNVNNMTEEQFNQDLKECQYESLKFAQVVDPRYGDVYGSFDLQERRQTLTASCMEVKGYRRISDEEYYARRKAKGL
jgi:hypothetical protein